MHFNLRGFLTKRAELYVYVQGVEPDIACVTETFLDASVGDMSLTGYELISRRDRDDGREGDGIATFAWKSIAQSIVHIAICKDSERCWHIAHGDQCSFRLGA